MWIVAKIKNKEFNILKKSLRETLGSEPELYGPKILVDNFSNNKISKKRKFILNDYIFMKHEKFNRESEIRSIKYLKGMNFILPFFNSSQNEIISFINKCKENENKFGYLSQSFFDLVINKKIQFKTGPFSKFVGALIEVQKNKLKVLVKNYLVSINSKKTIIF